MTYFAAASADEAIKFLNKRSSEWIETMVSSRYTQKLKELYASYHGAYYTNISSSHQILFSGEQGELVNLSVNHLRNFGQHMLVMTTSTRPTMEARAVNTDYKSLAQTHLANGLLDYYMREKRLEKYLRTAVEYSIVLGAGYVKMEWNNTTGEIYDYNSETGAPIYEGDVEFSNLSPMDVIFDTTKPSWNHDWIITRSRKNKYDIAAKYPEFASNLDNFTPAETMYDFHIHNPTSDTETDDVYVFEFYHKRSEALPNGRYMMYVDEDVVLYDGPLPYRAIPVFRIAPSDILGTVFGYTPLMDFLPIQESINSLYSTVMTNQNAFGVQNIYVPRGADISVNSLMGGLNIIEGNANAGKPEPLNLTNTPREVFDFIKMLEGVGETIMGISSVTRGNPEPNLRSGNAMALLQSQSLQFMSGLQQQYVQLIEDVGTALINMLKDFAEVPRVAAIVGKNNRTFMKQFKGEDLKSINRVIVDMGNPLSRSTAGKLEMAEQLLQMGAITKAHEYITVMNTGKLESMTEDDFSQNMLIKGENEKMIEGVAVPVLPIDSHILHIQEHSAILADPELRMSNPEILKVVLDHIQEHINSLEQVDPRLLQALGQQPLNAQPAAQGTPEGIPPVQEGNVGMSAAPNDQGQMQIRGPGIEGGQNIPSAARPPEPFANAPMTADEAMGGFTR